MLDESIILKLWFWFSIISSNRGKNWKLKNLGRIAAHCKGNAACDYSLKTHIVSWTLLDPILSYCTYCTHLVVTDGVLTWYYVLCIRCSKILRCAGSTVFVETHMRVLARAVRLFVDIVSFRSLFVTRVSFTEEHTTILSFHLLFSKSLSVGLSPRV